MPEIIVNHFVEYLPARAPGDDASVIGAPAGFCTAACGLRRTALHNLVQKMRFLVVRPLIATTPPINPDHPFTAKEKAMTGKIIVTDRRLFLTGIAAAGAATALGLPTALAQTIASGGLKPTETMRGGANNYIANAPRVDDLGRGFTVSGVVRRAGDGAPLANTRIQIWAATERGGEREPTNRGSVMTGSDGRYRLDISPIVPQFGQPHIHIAYDDQRFATLFLRPVLNSRHDKTMTVDFVLGPAGANEPRRS
jgi:hypothetical protein